MKNSIIKISIVFLVAFTLACGGGEKTKLPPAKHASESSTLASPEDAMKNWKENKGIGPVSSVTLTEVDQEMVDAGKIIFEEKCSACHKPDKKFIGPAPKGILERRTPEWVMNMILNPEEMTTKDAIAKQLLIEANGSPMANQNLTEDDARKVLEYFRTL
ncbi:c-type cytochrome [Fulvivirga lutimaris]|uniref:c-type cytochrome n=1 Tax=Fulvivirga lutimaris TaxID=1819566 RepID=UPI0012BB5E61|nr:cytochrome c [Fulvivirga lutimaris]MTI40449.1 cytochrome c [Fulvivirga lutimaris]